MRSSPQARPRGPRFILSGGFRLLMAWILCQCSLSLEDPAQEARDKLAKVVPTSMSLMLGRWIADSTFNSDDIHSTHLGGLPVQLEFLPDTSYTQMDSTGIAFPSKNVEGVFYLHVDTLIVFPLASPPDTLVVHLRFLGNYLEVVRPSEQRFTYFHKIKPWPPAMEDSLLGDSLWRMQGHRVDPGIYRPEALVRDFSYLRFRDDSMFSDIRSNGVVRLDSGPVEKDGQHWTWKASGGTREYLADLVTPDSLRIWPLTGNRPDSGWYDYIRTVRHHGNDIDMRRLIGHLRSDSLNRNDQYFDYHYGRFDDWILGEDHKVTMQTNMAGVPMWTSWSLDSGYLSLSAPGSKPQRMRVDTADGRVHLTPDSSAFFQPGMVLSMTRIPDRDYSARPLDRFDKASYLALSVGTDTAYYFFSESNSRDKFEIVDRTGGAARWAGFVLPKIQETFQSSQPDFYMAFQDSTKALGNFLCRSRPNRDLVIRQTVSPDPLMATGLIQGTCEIQKADAPITDSALVIEGSFKLLRKNQGGFSDPGWSLP